MKKTTGAKLLVFKHAQNLISILNFTLLNNKNDGKKHKHRALSKNRT
jgi:hypothetical protein